MSLINFTNLSFYFGARPIFSNLSLQIAPKERIGLVGANGRGKTTLLKLILGELRPEQGEVVISKTCRIGYLPQEIGMDTDDCVMDYVLKQAGSTRDYQGEIRELEEALSIAHSEEEQETLAHQLPELYEAALANEQEFSPHEAAMILHGLGFKESDLSRPVSHFSGGWKMRVQLGALLFSKPDLMLLDEPTNHLDLPSLAWVDNYLQSWRGAYVIISHDRDFLDRHSRRIFSLEPDGFKQYKGNYTQSRLLRAEEERVLDNRRKNVDRDRRQLERFVERFKAQASKARQAKSKAKLIKRLEQVEEVENEQRFTFTFPKVARTGDRVVVLEDLTKSFGENHLYAGVDMVVKRGERVGVVGVNGSGKTTLLRLMAGELSLDRGSITFGANVDWAYYAQHQTEALALENTVLEEMRIVAPSLGETQIRSILGAFLFRGEDVNKVIGVLSGGEKARVALAKLLVRPGNLLLMDEPTNHLDLEAAESLAEALENFEGTLFFVSHNRSFIDRLATTIWEVGDQSIQEFPGNLTEYMEFLSSRSETRSFIPADLAGSRRESEPRSLQTTSALPTEQGGSDRVERGESKAERRKREARERELLRQKLAPMKKKITTLEGRIEELETRNAVLEQQMVD
ncbi:ATP-binding cassette domain-containing protein, partial [Myxococcota bacterium]|nr:ATP-binding cassette domain-containing protein [Myxococcota bacterium]